jgi:hypothetical protein
MWQPQDWCELLPILSVFESKIRKEKNELGMSPGGNNGRVEEVSKELYDGVHPEEHDDFFATDGSVFASDMENHNCRHDNGHETCRC